MAMSAGEFKSARDFLIACGDDYCLAKTKFGWPKLERFNWALDWFDAELASGASGAQLALRILGEAEESWTSPTACAASAPGAAIACC
jgi:acetyl-CoA synthetase